MIPELRLLGGYYEVHSVLEALNSHIIEGVTENRVGFQLRNIRVNSFSSDFSSDFSDSFMFMMLYLRRNATDAHDQRHKAVDGFVTNVSHLAHCL